MKRLYKKIIVILFAVFTLQIFLCCNVFAKNNVEEIDIKVIINDDGSANVIQQWVGTFNEGTENYIPINTRDISISNFQVMMDDVKFTNVKNWNVKASFEEKKYKCGINRINEGIELCFGISKMGYNKYIFSYVVDGLVKSYTDKDGFNFMFVNQKMSTFPTNVKMEILLKEGQTLSSDNVDIWGFGFDGKADFDEGIVKIKTNKQLSGNNYIVILMNFDKGIINPRYEVNKSFEDARKEAFVGSDYEEYHNNKSKFSFYNILITLGILAFIASIISVIVLSIKRIIDINKFYKNCNYYRDTPNNGNIALSNILMKDFDIWNNEENNIIGSLILKMIKNKNLEPMQNKTVGFFGIEKVNTSLKILSEPTDSQCKQLYDLIVVASGEDRILQEKELEKYVTLHYEGFINFLKSFETEGHNSLHRLNGYKKVLGKRIEDLTDIGKQQLQEVFGLRKYLDEFTLISEREITEVEIWEEYLIYATLFGIAKKVLKTLKKVYPNYVPQIEKYQSTVYLSDMYNVAIYRNAMNAYNTHLSNASKMNDRAYGGGGGFTSIGGGGGFSGGGSGGGSR